MPLELPGFYFDEARNRYFPLASRPAPDPTRINDVPSLREEEEEEEGVHRRKRRRTSVWSVAERMRSTGGMAAIERDSHSIVCSQVASTSRATVVSVPTNARGAITSFCTTTIDGMAHCALGDTRGWLYSTRMREGEGEGATRIHARWAPELNLVSGISSIRMSGTRCVSTSFGPYCKIFVQDLAEPERTFILNPGERAVHDVWTSHLEDRSLVLGAEGKAVYLKDIDTGRSLQHLPTMSDTFAVHQQHQHLVYTGTRSGIVTRFDMRTERRKGQILLSVTGGYDRHFSPITHLQVVHDDKLLVARMNGELGLYDLRFPREESPVMPLKGHVNSFLPRLPVAVDPSENIVFAAGEDHRIRAWSLRTGEPLRAPANSTPANDTPLLRTFDNSVDALQVTDGVEGTVLWAAADDELFKYYLGQRNDSAPAWDSAGDVGEA